MNDIRVKNRGMQSVLFERLSNEQCKKIHCASLSILAETGICLHDEEAVGLLKAAGAKVTNDKVVCIPDGLVEKALTSAPKEITMFDRNGNPAMHLGSNRCYYGPGSDCFYIIDHRTGKRRLAILDDVKEGVRLCDSLPHIDFVMSMFLPNDRDQKVYDRSQMQVMLSNTTKPIVFVALDFEGCVDTIEMVKIVVGGEAALRQKPLVACYINVTSALNQNQEALQKLLYLSDKGVPFTYVPLTIGGITGPVTPAGSIALNNAGVLAGLVLSQLKREGTPFIAPAQGVTALDMKSMVSPYFDPDFRGLSNAMANYYQLPSFGFGGVSEAHLLDAENSAEAAITLVHETLSGSNLIHDLGYLDGGLSGSFMQLVLCNEMLGFLDHLMAPIEINDETLALDIINHVGHNGEYLNLEHTMRYFRNLWTPDLFIRNNHEEWEGAGSKNFIERATERVDKILSEYVSESLTDDVTEALKKIVDKAV